MKQYLDKMKAPRDKRPSVFRGGVLQIMITRACDQACFGCTQGSNLAGKPVMMTPDQFGVACDSLKGYWGVVGVFGGNPAIHPQFEEICEVMRDKVPFEQRGLWCNNPLGKGRACRETFNPAVSNLNVHLNKPAHDEFVRDWPECKKYLKGLAEDSRHSPAYVAMKDVIKDDEEIWRLASECDVNQYWSALIGVFRGELRGWFCELAGAQSMLHQNNPAYPDTGVPVVPGWWDQGMDAFEHQVRKHCFDCGIPLRGYGELAITGTTEQVSATHVDIYKPKVKGRLVEVVDSLEQLQLKPDKPSTKYLDGERLGSNK